MIQSLADWIRSLAYLVLAVTFLELLVPENQLNKLVKVIIGFVISAAIIMPIVNWVRTSRDLPRFEFYQADKPDPRPIVLPSTDTISRQATRLYQATLGLEVARYLNAQGIPAQVQIQWTPEAGVTEVIARLQDEPSGLDRDH